jgi:hypothetical protein
MSLLYLVVPLLHKYLFSDTELAVLPACYPLPELNFHLREFNTAENMFLKKVTEVQFLFPLSIVVPVL